MYMVRQCTRNFLFLFLFLLLQSLVVLKEHVTLTPSGSWAPPFPVTAASPLPHLHLIPVNVRPSTSLLLLLLESSSVRRRRIMAICQLQSTTRGSSTPNRLVGHLAPDAQHPWLHARRAFFSQDSSHSRCLVSLLLLHQPPVGQLALRGHRQHSFLRYPHSQLERL